jgi:hypothetical protein
MSEFGGLDFSAPAEGQSSSSESLSEEALARLQANAAAIAAIRKEEKLSKQKDDVLAQILLKFLQDSRYSHLFSLIARLIARNCPSIFILSIISLVHAPAKAELDEYIARTFTEQERKVVYDTALQVLNSQDLHATVLQWLTSVQMVLSSSVATILQSLLIDEKNIDGAVLQLSTFIVKDFFDQHEKQLPYEQVQPMVLQLLHSILVPYVAQLQKNKLA